MGQKLNGRLLFLGLDSAGKTTIIRACKNKFKPVDEPVVPTLSEEITHFNSKGAQDVDFAAWDLSGKEQYQQLWKHYFENTDAVVWVVDSGDSDERLEQSKDLLHHTLQDIKLKDSILLVCANKGDSKNARTASKITEILELNKIQKRTWKLQATCAKTGDGLSEGFVWLSTELKNKKANKK